MDLNPNKAPPTKRQSTLFGAIAVAREKKKRKRRTNQELRKDSNAKNASLRTLAQNLGLFVTRTTSNITTAISKFHIPWEKIRERDDEFEAVENNFEFDGDGGNDDYWDNDEEDDFIDGEGNINGDKYWDERHNTTMGKYLTQIQSQIRDESNTKKGKDEVDQWVMDYLRNNDFWIRREASAFVCARLGIQHDIMGYYRDVRVWLPDVQYNLKPPCPSCKPISGVSVHGYEKKTLARQIIGLNMNYSVMSCRNICHNCKEIDDQQSTYHGKAAKMCRPSFSCNSH